MELEFKFKKTYYTNKMYSTPSYYKCEGKGEISSGGSIKEKTVKSYLEKVEIVLNEYDEVDIDYFFEDEEGEPVHRTIYKSRKTAMKNISKCIMGYSS